MSEGGGVGGIGCRVEGFGGRPAAMVERQVDDDLVEPGGELRPVRAPAPAAGPDPQHCLLGDLLSVGGVSNNASGGAQRTLEVAVGKSIERAPVSLYDPGHQLL